MDNKMRQEQTHAKLPNFGSAKSGWEQNSPHNLVKICNLLLPQPPTLVDRPRSFSKLQAEIFTYQIQ
jgi:hypothetical protein